MNFYWSASSEITREQLRNTQTHTLQCNQKKKCRMYYKSHFQLIRMSNALQEHKNLSLKISKKTT